MSAGEVHQLDIGTIFEVTFKNSSDAVVNISTATVKQIIFTDPNSVAHEQTAAFTTDGADGKIRYTTILNDLDVVGNWKLQGYIEMPTGKWHSDISKFTVYPNID